MKRFFLIFAAILLCLTACAAAPGDTAPQSGHASEPGGTPGQAEASMRLKVASVYDSSFLGMGVGEKATAGELYFVSVKDTQYAGDTPAAPGTVLDVFYSGEIAETYPAELIAPFRIEQCAAEDDLVGLYTGVLKDLYEQDNGLNDGITVLGFDLTQANNLTESEKSALMYILCCEYDMEPVSGTYDELCEQGYIDKNDMFFPDGILFSIGNVEASGDRSFTFSVSKWRSGLGAIGMDECKAKYENGAWEYTPGGMWIS